MGTLGDKFSYLIATKNLMKTVLRNKGQSVSDDATFRSYVDKINNLVPPPSGTINIGQNGAHDVSNYANANVSVQPTLQTKNVSPSTSQQSITPDQNYDGLSEVTVGAVDNTIDNNIVSGNIKSGVTILGVNGSSSVVDTSDANAVGRCIQSGKTAYVNGIKITGTATKFITETSNPARMTRSDKDRNGEDISQSNALNNIKISGTDIGFVSTDLVGYYTDWTKVSLWTPATKLSVATKQSLLATKLDLTANKLVSGNTILGISGSAIELQGETKTVTPTTSQQTITPSSGKNGITEVTVNAVDETIDNNIVASNIKSGVSILGVAGTYTSDATATSGDIVKGKTAYVNGSKITGTYDISAEELMASYMAINALPFNHNAYKIFRDIAQYGTADYSLHTITYSPTDVYMYLDYIKTYEWIYLMSFPYTPEQIGLLHSLYVSSVDSYYYYKKSLYYNFNGTTSIEINQGIYKVIITVIISNDKINNISLSVYNTSTNTTVYSVSANIDFSPGGGNAPTTIQGDGNDVSKAIYMMLKDTPISNIKITSSALNSSSDTERICNNCAHLIDDYIKLITETE